MRDQHFAPDDFKAAVQLFGELQQHDKERATLPGHPDVSYVSNDEFVNGRRIISGRDVPHRPFQPSAPAQGDDVVRGRFAVERR